MMVHTLPAGTICHELVCTRSHVHMHTIAEDETKEARKWKAEGIAQRVAPPKASWCVPSAQRWGGAG